MRKAPEGRFFLDLNLRISNQQNEHAVELSRYIFFAGQCAAASCGGWLGLAWLRLRSAQANSLASATLSHRGISTHHSPLTTRHSPLHPRRSLLHAHRQESRSYEQYTANGNSRHAVLIEHIFHDPSKRQRCDDLWKNYEEVEDAHVNANLIRR